jgi:hypothetical protein
MDSVLLGLIVPSVPKAFSQLTFPQTLYRFHEALTYIEPKLSPHQINFPIYLRQRISLLRFQQFE